MKYAKFIIAILIMLLILVIINQNHNAFSTSVSFRLDIPPVIHLRTAEFSIYSITIIAFLFGVLITALYGIFDRFRMKKEIRLLKKTAGEKDAELNSLRNLPITSEEVTPPATNDETNVINP